MLCAFASLNAIWGAAEQCEIAYGQHHHRSTGECTADTRTVVVHRLLEALVALPQHLSVDVHDVHARLPVRVLLPRRVQYPECDVPSAARDVDAPQRPPRAGLEPGHELVLPQSMHTHGHGVVHEVVRARDAVEHIPHERLLRLLRDRLETKVRRPLVRVVAHVRTRRARAGRRLWCILLDVSDSGRVSGLETRLREKRPRVRETERALHDGVQSLEARDGVLGVWHDHAGGPRALYVCFQFVYRASRGTLRELSVLRRSLYLSFISYLADYDCDCT